MEQILGVADWRSFATTANSAFLLAFSSLFSIINPMGGALIFYGFTKDFSSLDRVKSAARVGDRSERFPPPAHERFAPGPKAPRAGSRAKQRRRSDAARVLSANLAV